MQYYIEQEMARLYPEKPLRRSALEILLRAA